MPIAGDSMPLPSNGHSLADAFKKASHGAERTLQPASTKCPKISEEDRPPPPSPPSLARIDESCGTCSPAPSGRNHGGHGSGHAAQDDAGKLGKRPPASSRQGRQQPFTSRSRCIATTGLASVDTRQVVESEARRDEATGSSSSPPLARYMLQEHVL